MTTAGLVIALYGLTIILINLFASTRGTVAPGAIIAIVAGLLLAGIGFARRLLAAVERR